MVMNFWFIHRIDIQILPDIAFILVVLLDDKPVVVIVTVLIVKFFP